jgi:DNA-3-methyladenine glycosylase I
MQVEVCRCPWATHPMEIVYHDEEWGYPIHDDRHFFEKLILDCAQAGLSWRTILLRREGYRAAYSGFDPAQVAMYDEAKCRELLADTRIIRNRAKVYSSVRNAQAFLAIQEEFGSFDAYVWRFVDGEPIVNHWRTLAEVPATSPESDALSKDLKSRGFSFVGSTIVYAFMQAAGLVDDHLVTCFRRTIPPRR